MQPVVVTQEQTAGLLLKPEETIVKIINEPYLDVAFSQFMANVGGSVECLGNKL